VATATAIGRNATARRTAGAAQERVRQAQMSRFCPRLEVVTAAGAFGARDERNMVFNPRGDALRRPLGVAKPRPRQPRQVREREALATEAGARVVETQALVAAKSPPPQTRRGRG